MVEELDLELDGGRGPAVDPPVGVGADVAPLLVVAVALPAPLALGGNDLGVAVQRLEDVVGGVRLGQEENEVEGFSLKEEE